MLAQGFSGMSSSCHLRHQDPYFTLINDHIQYETHSCKESYKKDKQVPVCPLCNKPIPLKKGQVADEEVGRHIDSDCQSDPAKERRKVYTNKCSMKGCKVKELIPVKCDKCHHNYCLRHRFETDHACKGFQDTGRSITDSGAAAIFRFQSSNGTSKSSTKPTTSKLANAVPQQRTGHSLSQGLGRELNMQRASRQQTTTENDLRAAQAGLSEEEILARAIQESLSQTTQPPTQNTGLSQEEEDRLLAEAIAASEAEARRQQQRTTTQESQNKKSCQVS
ncbi:AN1-type zinc finger protein 2B-like isoform X2 [Dreissena polymorpha]|uniref:AN1-type zinc finger protein 2B-like isoform X2 n=1 Tax=Dreissena polymorpha TaxID=45954 RepID=UPI00226457C1|nr:AN1-type zinc finger protein 2B-like isoform X2 [Dreissena polymorpha]